LSAVTLKELKRKARRRAFILIAIGVLLVTIPLAVTSKKVFKQNLIMRETMLLAEEWMKETDYGISRVDVSRDQVDLVIYGSGERPRLSELGDQLDASLDQPFILELIILPSEREEYVDVRE
jgi:hypothetical protein